MPGKLLKEKQIGKLLSDSSPPIFLIIQSGSVTQPTIEMPTKAKVASEIVALPHSMISNYQKMQISEHDIVKEGERDEAVPPESPGWRDLNPRPLVPQLSAGGSWLFVGVRFSRVFWGANAYEHRRT